MSELKQECWDMDVTIRQTMRITFEEEVTLEEATKLTLAENWYDVMDEYNFSVIDVHGGS